MSEYTLILTNQLTPPSQPTPVIMFTKARGRSPDGFRWEGGCSPRGGLALLEDDCDSDLKAKVVEKNYVDYSVGGEGRRTSAGVVCAGSLC